MTICIGHKFSSAEYRWLRTGTFIALGSTGIIPLVHSILKYGYRLSQSTMAVDHLLLMGALYIFGAWIYAYRIPERWYPRTFDIFGSSHQIWHLFVIAAAYTHYLGITKTVVWWHSNNPQCLVSDHQMMVLFA